MQVNRDIIDSCDLIDMQISEDKKQLLVTYKIIYKEIYPHDPVYVKIRLENPFYELDGYFTRTDPENHNSGEYSFTTLSNDYDELDFWANPLIGYSKVYKIYEMGMKDEEH